MTNRRNLLERERHVNGSHFHLIYETLLTALMTGVGSSNEGNHPWIRVSTVELNERTGHRVASLDSGFSFALDLQLGGDALLPVIDMRRLFPRTAAAELAWFVNGTQDIAFLHQLGVRIWDKFQEPDGTVEAAYGYRWRQHFRRDQLLMAMETLRENPTDRRIWVSTWDPAVDGLGRPSRNAPCPVGFSLSVVGGMLNSTYVLRSSDVFVGLPYDVMNQSLLMDTVAAELGLGVGTLQVSIAHPHLYDSHFELTRQMLELYQLHGDFPPTRLRMVMPGWSVSRILEDPAGYVRSVEVASADLDWPDFNPRPELIA